MTQQVLLWVVLGTVLPSLLVAWLATFAVRRLAPRWGLLDYPTQRKVHQTPTPLGGGLAIALGVLLPFALGQILLTYARQVPAASLWLPEFAREHLSGLWERSPGLWTLLAGATALMVVGLVDDLRSLDWRIRLFAQFLVAAACVLTQGWRLTAFIDLSGFSWLVSVVLSVVWIVALINSFNMLDNMDGLSAGVGAIAADDDLVAAAELVGDIAADGGDDDIARRLSGRGKSGASGQAEHE